MERPLAIVTGGGRGYGTVVARHLAGAGMNVAVLGRDAEAVNAVARDVDGVAVVADVLDRPALAALIADVAAAHGPPAVLVNNAGVGGSFALAWEADPDDWWRTIEVNLRGTHTATAVVLPYMIEAGAGRVINVVSHAGATRWPHGSSYAVSKAAVIKHGENVAAEVRRHGVVVLNFNPGILEIGLTKTLFDSQPAPGTLDAMVADWFRKQIADGHGIDADASAKVLVRLARGDADRLTGRYLTAYDDLDSVLAEADSIAQSSAYTMGILGPES